MKTTKEQLNINAGLFYGSHLPVLLALVQKTTGPIVELGSGINSTPFLHWMCHSTERPLVTIEGDPEWFEFANQYKKPWHEIWCVDDWDKVDLGRHWSLALVDHSPGERRWKELLRLGHAEYVLAHDAENTHSHLYHYYRANRAFKYRTKYSKVPGPATAIYSNLHDVRDLVL